MKQKLIILSLLSSFGFSLSANVTSNFYNDSKDGYFYYKIEPKKKKKEKIDRLNKKKLVQNKQDLSTMEKMDIPFETHEERQYRRKKEKEYIDNIPWDELDELSADEYRLVLDTTRDISVATPKKEYVKAYALLQKFWVDKSEDFSKVWKVSNLENPEQLTYTDFETSSAGRKIAGAKKTKEQKNFFVSKKNRLGYIIIVDNLHNKQEVDYIKRVYSMIKEEYQIDFLIFDGFQVPSLIRKLKIKPNELPVHYFNYRGNKNKEIYKRVSTKKRPSMSTIIKNTQFIFENVLLEKDKNKKDRIK